MIIESVETADIVGPDLPDMSLRAMVHDTVNRASVLDMHTHLFAPEFGPLNLYGIDEILTYHYLLAEFFRMNDIAEEKFWSLPKHEQANLIWETMFVRNSPLSESGAGVVRILSTLGLDPQAPNLREARAYYADISAAEHIDNIMRLAGVEQIVMTNDPLDPAERRAWDTLTNIDTRFKAVVRLDGLLNGYTGAVAQLQADGYKVDESCSAACCAEVRRFLGDWVKRMKPVYVAVSLPDDFEYPSDDVRGRLLAKAVLPLCREHNLPLALMIGVRRQVNPRLRLAGDGVGCADLTSLQNLCASNPDNRFLVTLLARENQHDLCVAARKFRNLMPFGCWWFLNNPSLISEITRMRLEMLGVTFIPQHSDARVMEQLLYKWPHSRRVIADALADNYEHLERNGLTITRELVSRDVNLLFRENFRKWAQL